MKTRIREAIGILYTASETFLILKVTTRYSNYIGTPFNRKLDYEMDEWVYSPSARLYVEGDHVLMEWNQPKEVYIYVEESENETSE